MMCCGLVCLFTAVDWCVCFLLWIGVFVYFTKVNIQMSSHAEEERNKIYNPIFFKYLFSRNKQSQFVFKTYGQHNEEQPLWRVVHNLWYLHLYKYLCKLKLMFAKESF